MTTVRSSHCSVPLSKCCELKLLFSFHLLVGQRGMTLKFERHCLVRSQASPFWHTYDLINQSMDGCRSSLRRTFLESEVLIISGSDKLNCYGCKFQILKIMIPIGWC